MDTAQLAAVWEQVLKMMEKEIIKPIFDTWIRATIPLSLNETTMEIGTPSQFIKDWIETRYAATIQSTVQQVTGKPLDIKFTNLNLETEKNPPADQPSTNENDYFPLKKNDLPLAESEPILTTNDYISRRSNGNEEFLSSLNPKYTFETFVIGNSNRFAHAASLAEIGRAHV